MARRATGTEDEDISGAEFVRRYDLSEVDWKEKWDRIYINEKDKEKLINYGLLEQQLQAASFDQMTLSRHGAVLLSGPPGTGKTTLAKGAAYKLAEEIDREALGLERVVFKQIEVRNLFSSDHGDTPKLVEEAFDRVIKGGQRGHTYQVVLLDEVESLFANRGLLGDTDPMDAIRAVNTALDCLDALSDLDNIYVIATSNQPGAVDSAFVDRTDEQIYIGNPEPKHRRQILEDIFTSLEEAFETQLSPTDEHIETLVRLSDGFSGRRMRKSVLSALARETSTVRDPATLSIDQLLREFKHKREMLDNAGNDYIQLGVTPDQPNDASNDNDQEGATE
ncbi:ATP-binding protein [Haloarcula halophila]|uniref:ATP-binding protein n=1 Tax=Haloarcula TaxID=2237 RepID=UPI0023E3832E|nr:AAA family ATPase [Halomicroarcula sp. DFY41]